MQKQINQKIRTKQGAAESEMQTKKIIDRLIERHSGEEIRYTNCWQNGCFTSLCIAKWRIKDGKAIAIETDDTINPNNAREDLDQEIQQGMIQLRPCAMGHSWIEDIYDPKRIIYPMKRVGERGDGKYVRITWDEAIDTITKKLKEIKDKYGPNSIMASESAFETSAFPLGPWFQAGVCGYGSVSYGGPDTAMAQWMGHDIVKQIKSHDPKWGNPYTEAQDFFNSKLIVLWGWNMLARDYQIFPYYLKLARERGIPIICIDPIYNWTAEILADQYIPIRPGTDLAMLLAVADVLFQEDLYDHEYVGKWVEPEGLARFRDYVLGVDDGEEKTPEWAETKCGVPAETIRAFSKLYASSKPTALRFAISCGRQHRGEYQTAIAMILQAMTGNTAVPGGFHAGVEMGAGVRFAGVPVPGMLHGRAPFEYEAPVLLNIYKWYVAVLRREDLDNEVISVDEYNRLIGNEPGNTPPNIKCVIFSGHHVNNMFDVNPRIEALKKLEFSFGWHFSFEQLTPNYEDIVLPASYPMEDNDDWIQRYLQFPISPFMLPPEGFSNHMSYRGKIINPPGEVRDREWFWTQVANRLGIGEKYNPRLYNVSLEEWDTAIQAIHEQAYNIFANNPDTQLAFGGNLPTWDEFKQKPILRIPVVDTPHYSFKEHIEAGVSPFNTPSNKIEFFATSNEGFEKTRHAGYLDPLPRWKVPYMNEPPLESFFHPKAAKYPLVMVTPVSQYRQHSLHDSNPLLREDSYRHAVWISVSDAKQRGIKDNDLVRVHNDNGEMYIPAYVTARMTPGVCAIYHGAWYTPNKVKTELMPNGIDRRGAPNFLVPGEYGQHNNSAYLTTGLVEVEKL